jgi:hypothetical protein
MDDTENRGERVSFGPRDDDSMPLSWAERGLTWLRETRPNVFRDLILVALELDRKRRS